MNVMLSPEIRDLQQKQEETRVALAKTQGEVEVTRRNSEHNDHQTYRQFLAFLVIMIITVAGSLIGASAVFTDSLRREMNARFDGINQRLEMLEKRQEKTEKTLEEIKDLLRARK